MVSNLEQSNIKREYDMLICQGKMSIHILKDLELLRPHKIKVLIKVVPNKTKGHVSSL